MSRESSDSEEDEDEDEDDDDDDDEQYSFWYGQMHPKQWCCCGACMDCLTAAGKAVRPK